MPASTHCPDVLGWIIPDEHPVLVDCQRVRRVAHFLLLAVDPTCEDDDVQLPAVEEEIHDRPVGVK